MNKVAIELSSLSPMTQAPSIPIEWQRAWVLVAWAALIAGSWAVVGGIGYAAFLGLRFLGIA